MTINMINDLLNLAVCCVELPLKLGKITVNTKFFSTGHFVEYFNPSCLQSALQAIIFRPCLWKHHHYRKHPSCFIFFQRSASFPVRRWRTMSKFSRCCSPRLASYFSHPKAFQSSVALQCYKKACLMTPIKQDICSRAQPILRDARVLLRTALCFSALLFISCQFLWWKLSRPPRSLKKREHLSKYDWPAGITPCMVKWWIMQWEWSQNTAEKNNVSIQHEKMRPILLLLNLNLIRF